MSRLHFVSRFPSNFCDVNIGCNPGYGLVVLLPAHEISFIPGAHSSITNLAVKCINQHLFKRSLLWLIFDELSRWGTHLHQVNITRAIFGDPPTWLLPPSSLHAHGARLLAIWRPGTDFSLRSTMEISRLFLPSPLSRDQSRNEGAKLEALIHCFQCPASGLVIALPVASVVNPVGKQQTRTFSIRFAWLTPERTACTFPVTTI
jgi:hypothetical protein